MEESASSNRYSVKHDQSNADICGDSAMKLICVCVCGWVLGTNGR